MVAKASPKTETFNVDGKEVVGKIKSVIREGNVRHITVKSKTGRVILDLPLTLGIVGALIAPALAALGAVVALITECTITVERES